MTVGKAKQLRAIKKYIKEVYEVPFAKLIAKNRQDEYIALRFIAWLTLSEAFGWSDADIAREFKRNRTTVARGIETIRHSKSHNVHREVRHMTQAIMRSVV